MLKLRSGYEIPIVGLGTFQNKDPVVVAANIVDAFDAGYRHFDCATAYANQVGVGNGLKQVLAREGVNREDIFVTSKVASGTGPTPDDVRKDVEDSLLHLQLDYIDLYLIHSPVLTISLENGPPWAKARHGSGFGLQDRWRVLEKMVDEGKIRSLGVSNFNVQCLNDLLSYSRLPCVCNQIEFHVYLQQPSLVEWSRSCGVETVAYASLGAPGRAVGAVICEEAGVPTPLQNELVLKIAAAHKKTPAQVLLRFVTTMGVVVIPKSTKVERIVENFDVLLWDLDEAEVEALKKLDGGIRLYKQDWHGVPVFK